MKQGRGRSSSRRRGIQGASAGKRAADSRALALILTIRKLGAPGFVSYRALADELNRRRIPTALGGRWHLTTVVRMLTRVGLTTLGKGRTHNRLAHKQAADARAKALASTIRKLRKAGFVSLKAMARELNEQGIPTARGCKWHRSSVRRLLRRLEKLESARCRRRVTLSRSRSGRRHRR
jgi:recombinase